jgi:DnaK suppressor protein
MSSAPNIDLKAMKKRLLERRKELEHVMEARAETQTDSELDQQRVGRLSRMDAIQQQAMEEETGRRRDQEIDRIASALKRIEDDDFGYCRVCEEPIAPKRLENDPATPLCVACAGRVN